MNNNSMHKITSKRKFCKKAAVVTAAALFLNSQLLSVLPADVYSLRPLAASEKNKRTVLRAVEIIQGRMKEVNSAVEQEFAKLPADGKVHPLPESTWAPYNELFREVCDSAAGLPEFDNLKNKLSGGNCTEEVAAGLTKIFLDAGFFISFGMTSAKYNGRLAQDVPSLAIYRVSEASPRQLDFMGAHINSRVIIIEKDPVLCSMGTAEIVGTTIHDFSLDGDIPVVINRDLLRERFKGYHASRSYLADNKRLARPAATGHSALDNIVNKALEGLLIEQWPRVIKDADEFLNEYYEDFEEMHVLHEAIHWLVGNVDDERLPYLAEIINSRYVPYKLYQVLRTQFVPTASFSLAHANCARFFLIHFLPEVFLHTEAGSIKGVPARAHRSAARKMPGAVTNELLMNIPRIPDEIMKREAGNKFLELLLDLASYLKDSARQASGIQKDIIYQQWASKIEYLHQSLFASPRPMSGTLPNQKTVLSAAIDILRPLASIESEGDQRLLLPRSVHIVRYSELSENDPRKAAFSRFIGKYKMLGPWGDHVDMYNYVIATENKIVHGDESGDPAKRRGKHDRIILLEGNKVVGMLAFNYHAAKSERVDYNFMFVEPGARNVGYGMLLWEMWFDSLDKDFGTLADRDIYFVRRIGECHFWEKVMPRLRQRGINGMRIGFEKAWDLIVTCRAGQKLGIGVGNVLDLEGFVDQEVNPPKSPDELDVSKRIISVALTMSSI